MTVPKLAETSLQFNALYGYGVERVITAAEKAQEEQRKLDADAAKTLMRKNAETIMSSDFIYFEPN